MNALLASHAADIITEDTLQELILKQIHAGAMLASWESVQVHLTGRQQLLRRSTRLRRVARKASSITSPYRSECASRGEIIRRVQ